MAFSINSHMHVLSFIGSLCAALIIIVVRLRSASKPVRVMKIIMPPIGMSTGFFMFLFPRMQISYAWAVGAFLVGAMLLSYPLIRTSRFQIVEGQIFLQRSKAFVWILLILLFIRLALHQYVEKYISIYQTGGVFFILAFGMLLPWRIVMYTQFRKLMNNK